ARSELMQYRLFSFGHSTHLIEQFLVLLELHDIEVLADVRRFPGSLRHPQFGQDILTSTLRKAGIDYHWFEALGGRRGKSDTRSSENLGLRNESFRNYADYMRTNAFHDRI